MACSAQGRSNAFDVRWVIRRRIDDHVEVLIAKRVHITIAIATEHHHARGKIAGGPATVDDGQAVAASKCSFGKMAAEE